MDRSNCYKELKKKQAIYALIKKGVKVKEWVEFQGV